jgi:hypothetical protein
VEQFCSAESGIVVVADQPSRSRLPSIGSRSDIHSGEHPLMSFFAFQRNKEASNAKKVTVAERSEHRGAGEPVSKSSQRLAGLCLVGTAVGFGVAKQCFKTNLTNCRPTSTAIRALCPSLPMIPSAV